MAEQNRSDLPIRRDGLQLDEQRRRGAWTRVAQRVIRALCLGLVVLALAGGTGRGGPLATRQVRLASAQMDLPRVTRRGATDMMLIRFRGPGQAPILGLPAQPGQRFEIETITPRPLRKTLTHDGVSLMFAADDPAPHVVALYLRARAAGLMRGGGCLATRRCLLPS